MAPADQDASDPCSPRPLQGAPRSRLGIHSPAPYHLGPMAPPLASEPRADANTVTIATWLVPGAGHLLLGRGGFALVAFLVVEGLYVLGWALSQGRTFEFLDPELRGPFATLLAPEAGNLGALIAQMKLVGFGPADPRPYPAWIHLGSFLAGLSGMLNGCLMAHAHLAARAPRALRPAARAPALLVLAAWAVPGLGHLLQGRKRRAAIVFGLLLGLFAWGTWLAEGSNLSRERHFYYWAGQFLIGLPAFLAEVLSGRPPVTRDMAHVDAGLLIACMGGLLNVLAMLDVYGVAERRWLDQPDGVDGAADGGPQPESAA